MKVFQSTPPRGRRHVSPLLSHLGNGHFNPRLREGGDVKEGQILLIIDISIHASAREATGLIIKKYVNDYISIHASAREATALFQDSLPLTEISIHASAREATYVIDNTGVTTKISIHASAREATDAAGVGVISREFQSTPPRGRRPVNYHSVTLHFRISIHASAREATEITQHFGR